MTDSSSPLLRRPRRLRAFPALRNLVAETRLSKASMVAPLFVKEGAETPVPIGSLPGHFQHTVMSLVDEVRELMSFGITSVLLFGIPEASKKDALGSQASHPTGIGQLACKALRDTFGDDVVVIADLCLDEYTDHGHCGVIISGSEQPNNDATLERYGEIAVAQARAGAHIVAPSGMMDGQVAAIRRALDDEGFVDVSILAYAAKYASALYGPFRDAVNVSIVNGGNRDGYQMDARNAKEAIREVLLDIGQGADMVMVKPATLYLDVIAAVRAAVHVPVAAYHVSGEYAMVKAAAAQGWVDGEALLIEQLVAIRRAGADVIVSYAAKELAQQLS